MPEVEEVFRMATQKVRPEPGFEDRQHDRRRKKERSRKIGAFVVMGAIAAVVAVIVVRSGPDERHSQPADPGPSRTVPEGLEVDYVLDLNTGVMTRLPQAIIRSLGETAEGREAESHYAASRNGSKLAYVGMGDDLIPQIFVAGIHDRRGTGLQQVTHDPKGAVSPAWSPDGTLLAYVGYGSGDVQNLFVLEIATGETRQITDGTRDLYGPSFTPDGSSLVYTDPGIASDGAEMRTVPLTGGESTILFGGGHGGMGQAGGGSMSPDGSLVTMTGHEVNGPGAVLFISDADGTHRRTVGAYGTTPAGTWSPDGSRIVALGYGQHRILVVDVATGEVSRVAEGRAATWLDDHTLLVEA